MHASQQMRQVEQPASSARGIRPKSLKTLRLTIAVDGSWFTLSGDRLEDSGFDVRISSDGSNANLTIHADEADSPLPALRLYLDRPA